MAREKFKENVENIRRRQVSARRGLFSQVAFNPVYLMEPLKILEGDEIFVELTDNLSPGVIKNNTPFLYVLMPMRTN